MDSVGGALLSGLLLLSCTGCLGSPEPHQLDLEGEALGTVWSVALVTRDPIVVAKADRIRARVTATLDRVDIGMSTWRDDSEIAGFNGRDTGKAYRFSPETGRVVAAALDLARQTGGAFDPTVGPLLRLWGFGPGAVQGEPDPEVWSQTRERVGWQKLRWEGTPATALQGPTGVELDLSAIAKGYAVDAIVTEIGRERPIGLLVEVGGEVRALGTAADGGPWRLGIDDPTAAGIRIETVLALTDSALATSGDYRLFRIVGPDRLSHVIDPRSGRPAGESVASASVVAPTCMEADAVATALIVLGPGAGIEWVEERPWLDALMLIRDGERIVERRASSGWANRVADPR